MGLDRGDGRRPDGLTTFPFSAGRSLTWDATCVDTFAESHVVKCAVDPGAAAAVAENLKRMRYASLADRYIFTPVAVETTGVVGEAGSKLLRDIGGRISAATKDPREVSWLLQRVSIAIIRGNSAAILATAPPEAGPRHVGCVAGRTSGPAEESDSAVDGEVAPPASSSKSSVFGQLIENGRKLAPSDFEVPWGEIFGAKPKH